MIIALILLILPNGAIAPLGNFAYACMQHSPSRLVLNSTVIAPAPQNATELMDLFLYINSTLARARRLKAVKPLLTYLRDHKCLLLSSQLGARAHWYRRHP